MPFGAAITTCLFLRVASGGDVQDSLRLLEALEPEIQGRLDGNRLLPVLIGEPSSVFVFLIYKNAINSGELSVWPCQPVRIRNETAGWGRFILLPVAESFPPLPPPLIEGLSAAELIKWRAGPFPAVL